MTVIKTCKVHGNLSFEQTIQIKKTGEITCRKCRHNQMKREYQKKNPEYYQNYYKDNQQKVSVRLKSYRQRPEIKQKNKILSKIKTLKRWEKKYGITIEEYNIKLQLQNHTCEICRLPESSYDSRLKITKKLAVDHCHITLKNRGLLCSRCNLMLGRCNENIELLQSMINYLTKYNQTV